MTGIVGTFFVKQYLGLSAEFLAALAFWAGIPWALKRPGDLIFFSYAGAGGPHHVAIYVGGDRILHAPRTGDVVRYGTIGEFSGEVMTVRRLG